MAKHLLYPGNSNAFLDKACLATDFLYKRIWVLVHTPNKLIKT